MAGSGFGDILRVTNFGESHGPAIGCVIDGCPPGMALAESDIQPDLDRRRPGTSRHVTQRREADRVQILSGVFEGLTTGTPIALLIANTDQRSGDYANLLGHPLREATLADLDSFPWPDPADNYDFKALRKPAKKLYEEGKYALVGCLGSPGNIFEQAWYLRGLQEFMTDLITEKEFAHALMRKVLDVRKRNVELYLHEVGEFIDVVQLADDLAGKDNLLISPKTYREMVKPYQLELCRHVRGLTKAKIYYHSCGSISPLIDELIDNGVEILNPVQVSAANMDTAELKKRFGRNLSFWGAVDTYDVLPNGTPRDVEAEVRRRITDLGTGGGYVMAPVHNICADVSPENIVAMYRTSRAFNTADPVVATAAGEHV